MGLIRRAMIFTILGTMFLGIAAVNAQVDATLPQFKSGASVMMGIPVDFNILDQRVGAIYNVVESDDNHIVWKFTGSTGDWAFVFADGRIVVASTTNFDLATKDTTYKELNDVIDMLNVVNPELVNGDARNNALDAAMYYANDSGIYHRIKYQFSSNFDFTLMVPECTVKMARLTITGCDDKDYPSGGCLVTSEGAGQYYNIDGIDVTSCYTCPGCCDVPTKDIAKEIPSGLHKIKARSINNAHTMTIEIITSPMPPKDFVLYGPKYIPWINETPNSMDLQALQTIIDPPPTHPNCTSPLPGGIIGIDPTSHPKVKVNVFVNTSCAKSGELKREDFNVKENDKDVTIDSAYFTGNASGEKLDLAIVFDDTSSMGGEIKGMKSKVQDLIDQIKASEIDADYSLVSFKDSASIKTKWTNDSDVFKKYVNSLNASGGGDEREDSMDAIETILSMGFRQDAQKVILVITDAHAHSKGDGTAYSNYTKEELMKDLSDKGVIFIPVSPIFKSSTTYVDLMEVANEMQSMWIDINSADFSTILEQFKSIITGTYVLEYTSPDLTPNTNRNVSVTVCRPGCAEGSTLASYTTKA
jgi:hypothetical protein